MDSWRNNTKWLLAGASAGLAVDLSLYPLDTLKTRLQSKQGFKVAGGFHGLYRGMGSVALGSAPGAAFFFVTYQQVRSLSTVSSSLTDASAASCGEMMACLIRVPTEVVKQRAQVSKQSVSRIACDLFKAGGIAQFYQGYWSTLTREIPFAFLQYPLWEQLKKMLAVRTNLNKATPVQSATAGSIAGAFSAGITTPLDVVKTRIMLGSSLSSNPYVSLVHILQSEGVRPLFSGVVPRCLWMGMGGYVYFFAYEFTVSGLGKVL